MICIILWNQAPGFPDKCWILIWLFVFDCDLSNTLAIPCFAYNWVHEWFCCAFDISASFFCWRIGYRWCFVCCQEKLRSYAFHFCFPGKQNSAQILVRFSWGHSFYVPFGSQDIQNTRLLISFFMSLLFITTNESICVCHSLLKTGWILDLDEEECSN